MPLGLQRYNERTQRPNTLINFIQPLPAGPDTAAAQAFLERIAAQCYPIMKQHGLAVMTLEEHEPNREFLGRNFNAGEVVQLVLKDRSGRWLSFRFVQMVMMHELAHCKQMNHSRAFWSVRNGYAHQMEELWAKGYTGEGMWGRGKDLASGDLVHDHMPEDAQMPEHLCGGTYRRRGTKRRRGRGGADRPRPSYAERQRARIVRKFGKHGEGAALGEDDLVRGALDRVSGQRHPGKPRVASSKRGRELRAAAALARFDAAKKPPAPAEPTPKLEEEGGSETESDWGWSSDEDTDSGELGGEGGRVKSRNGHDMIQVCGDEGEEDEEGGKGELEELWLLSGRPEGFAATMSPGTIKADPSGHAKDSRLSEDDAQTRSPASVDEARSNWPQQDRTGTTDDADRLRETPNNTTPPTTTAVRTESADMKQAVERPAAPGMPSCPICSLENARDSPTCAACSHVLRPSLVKDHWRCQSEACRGTAYTNAGDVGRCGLCGARKPQPSLTAGGAKPVGLTSAATLRWD